MKDTEETRDPKYHGTICYRWLFMRCFTILVLAIAAIVQGYNLLLSITFDNKNFLNYGTILIFILLEIIFVLWLLWNKPARWVWFFSVLLFAGFILYSVYKELSGSIECNCFGNITISPYFAILFDSFYFVLLLYGRPYC